MRRWRARSRSATPTACSISPIASSGGAGVPCHVYRALAFEIRGDWASALAALDEAPLDRAHASWRLLAATVRVAAFTETGKVAEARTVFDRDLKTTTRDPSA